MINQRTVGLLNPTRGGQVLLFLFFFPLPRFQIRVLTRAQVTRTPHDSAIHQTSKVCPSFFLFKLIVKRKYKTSDLRLPGNRKEKGRNLFVFIPFNTIVIIFTVLCCCLTIFFLFILPFPLTKYFLFHTTSPVCLCKVLQRSGLLVCVCGTYDH